MRAPRATWTCDRTGRGARTRAGDASSTPPASLIAVPASAERDRYIDFLRAGSIVVVVIGHWAIGVNHWTDGFIRSTNAIGLTPGLWIATWFLQVIPVFFFIGGFSNYTAYQSMRRAESKTPFVFRRALRLMTPFAVFVVVWLVVQVGLHVLDIGAQSGPRIWDATLLLRGVRPPGATIPFGPLWFLAVYFAVVLVAPAMVELHERFRVWVPVLLFAGVFVVDGLRFAGGLVWVGHLNVVFAFLFFHQLGFFYADGTLSRASRSLFIALAASGLVTMIVLTNPALFQLLGDVGPKWFSGMPSYPRSLLGTDAEPVTNTYPPTIVFAAAGLWVIAGVMLLGPLVRGWLEGARPWRVTVALNRWIMTLYLWHMTAYLLAILLLWPLGFGHEQSTTCGWWLERPIWIIVPGLLLAGIVAMFGRVEALGHHRVAKTL